jgi:hypothetical protein
MELNNSNYHSNEANRYYMSNSQYKEFMECEAMAMAKIRGDFIQPDKDAYMLGSYVHAWMEGTLDQFKEQNPALFTGKGELYAKYAVGDRMIMTLHNDRLINFLMNGEKEVIFTANMFGMPWKAKFDIYNRERGRIIDLKTVQGLYEKYWDKSVGAYVSFIEAFNYPRQIAVYAEMERIVTGRDGWAESLIIAVTKESEPDKEVIGFDSDRIRYELEVIEQNMPRIIQVKTGAIEPERCGKCTYCKRTKQLKSIKHYAELAV